MNSKRKRVWMKRAAACMLTAIVIMAGITVKPMTTDAAENQNDEVIYEELEMSSYWTPEKKTAPVKDGYVFGGWYQNDESGEKKAITEEGAKDFQGQAYAKFVPAYVLSVKAQIQSAAEIGNADATYLRLVTAVDSTDYQNISFDVWINNKIKVPNVPVITTVYNSIENSEGKITAANAFGAPASKLAVLRLTQIAKVNYRKIIYVRPYWTTLDGTKVEGLTKYLRVEDGFLSNKYISVPINLLEQKEVAAGVVELSYADYKYQLEVAKDSNGNYLIDAGRVLPSMEYYVDEEKGTIRFLGNGTVDEYKNGEVLYANVRFRVKDGVSLPNTLLFKMQEGMFCDWKENAQSVNAWDYRY